MRSTTAWQTTGGRSSSRRAVQLVAEGGMQKAAEVAGSVGLGWSYLTAKFDEEHEAGSADCRAVNSKVTHKLPSSPRMNSRRVLALVSRMDSITSFPAESR